MSCFPRWNDSSRPTRISSHWSSRTIRWTWRCSVLRSGHRVNIGGHGQSCISFQALPPEQRAPDPSSDYGLKRKGHDDVIKWKHFPRYWPLCGEFIGHRWIPRTKASDAEPWSFLLIYTLNKRLSKQSSWGWWFETLLRSVWRHCNGLRVEEEEEWNDINPINTKRNKHVIIMSKRRFDVIMTC